MKNILFCSVLLGILTANSYAEVVKVVCDQAKDASRAESIQAVTYTLNTSSGKAQIGCSTKLDREFCESIRMDLSKFLGSYILDVDNCKNPGNESRQTFNFFLAQEDEFDNLVTLTIYKSCKTGKIMSDISAVITNNPSGENPESAEVVKCNISR